MLAVRTGCKNLAAALLFLRSVDRRLTDRYGCTALHMALGQHEEGFAGVKARDRPLEVFDPYLTNILLQDSFCIEYGKPDLRGVTPLTLILLRTEAEKHLPQEPWDDMLTSERWGSALAALSDHKFVGGTEFTLTVIDRVLRNLHFFSSVSSKTPDYIGFSIDGLPGNIGMMTEIRHTLQHVVDCRLPECATHTSAGVMSFMCAFSDFTVVICLLPKVR